MPRIDRRQGNLNSAAHRRDLTDLATMMRQNVLVAAHLAIDDHPAVASAAVRGHLLQGKAG